MESSGILIDSKKSKKLLMMLGGVKKEYRGKGLDVLMGVKILQSAIKHKMETLDSHLVLEDNTKMRGEYERVGCHVVKKLGSTRKNYNSGYRLPVTRSEPESQ